MVAQGRLDAGAALALLLRAVGGRISIPLSLARARLEALTDNARVQIEGEDPGLRVTGEAHALGAPVRFSARIDAEGVQVHGEQRTVRVYLSQVELETDDDAPGPLADAIRNGMIDTEHPATLIGNMTSLPDMVVEAHGREITIDLMKAPPLQRDARLRALVAAATSALGVTGISIADDTIQLELGILPGGPKEAALSTARAVLLPVVRYLWPESRL